MTRVCRTKFERDDLDEAMITCGLQPSLPLDVEAQSPSNHARKNDNEAVEHDSTKRSRIWRAPRIFPFNYATSPPHAHRDMRRRPIPFENADILYAPVRAESPQTTEFSHNVNSMNGGPGSKSALVSPRPPHPRWNDEPDPDHPYDNPYYTNSITNTNSTSLWLPRNPCGVLDLDNTVDLNKALTSMESSGALGSWIVTSPGQPVLPDPRPSALERSPVDQPSLPPQTPISIVQRGPSGNDVILLPTHMTSRIHSARVQQVPQPKPTYGWFGRSRHWQTPSQITTTQTNATTWPPIRPPPSEGRPDFGPSSRSASLPIVGWRRLGRSTSLELAELTNMLPVAQTEIELSAQPSEHEPEAGASTISPAEVVVHEVYFEEQIAEEERLKQEAEENIVAGKRPWWMRMIISTATT
jgi:hypothetical protein